MTDHHRVLRRRADRGTARGAEAVWAAANEEPYVADYEAAPRRSRALWWAAGAAACMVIVAGIALRPSNTSEGSVAYVGEASSSGPAMCLLEVADDADRALPDWAAAAEQTEEISGVEIIDVRSGSASLSMLGHPNVEVPAGTRGISFQARPARVAEELGDVPGVDQLRCWVAPDWAWVPDEPPAGTRPLIAFYTPETGLDVYEHWRTIVEMDGVVAAEPFTQQQSYEEFAELYADTPGVVAAVSADILPPSVRIVADAEVADELIARLHNSRDVYRVVEPPPPLWHSREDYEIEAPDSADTGRTTTTTTAISTATP